MSAAFGNLNLPVNCKTTRNIHSKYTDLTTTIYLCMPIQADSILDSRTVTWLQSKWYHVWAVTKQRNFNKEVSRAKRGNGRRKKVAVATNIKKEKNRSCSSSGLSLGRYLFANSLCQHAERGKSTHDYWQIQSSQKEREGKNRIARMKRGMEVEERHKAKRGYFFFSGFHVQCQ